MRIFQATKAHVFNRGIPPDSFLDELIEWALTAPDAVFAKNTVPVDIYTSVEPVLGPWQSLLHRKAAMLEVLRVLAGFESSWNWNAGRDTTNPTSITPTTIEAGAWQVSANSLGFGQDLKELVLAAVATLDGDSFQRAMKSNHPLAIEYIARLLRHTVRHNGPVLRHEIDAWLRKDAVAEFESLLRPQTAAEEEAATNAADIVELNRSSAKRLGWSAEDFGCSSFDEQLVAAIRGAQRRLEVEVDGKCGPLTYGALLLERQRSLSSGLAAPEARLANAGVIAVCEAKRAWLRDIVDLPPPSSPVFEASRRAIDDMIRSDEGIGWSWEGPYNDSYEWCGAFVGYAWRAGGVKLPLRKTYFSSNYRLDRFGRYAVPFENTPNPRPATGPFRKLVELDENSGPLDARFAEDDPPRPGDILLVGGKSTVYGKHVTLVESYDPSTGYFTTLEGNATGPGPSGGARHGVIRTRRPVGLPNDVPLTTYHARRLIRVAPGDLLP